MSEYIDLRDHKHFKWMKDMGLIETAIIEFPRYSHIYGLPYILIGG